MQSHNLGSNPSIYSGGHNSPNSTGSIDQITSPTTHQSTRQINAGEDLYSWMAKQQEFIKDNDKSNLKGNWVNIVIYLINYLYFIIAIYCRTCQVFRTEQKAAKVSLVICYCYLFI